MGGYLIREARLRAGMTQRRLAELAGMAQPMLARIEKGKSRPPLDLVNRLVRICGFEIEVRLVEADDSNWSVASTNLALDVDTRVRQNSNAVRFLEAGRAAMQDG